MPLPAAPELLSRIALIRNQSPLAAAQVTLVGVSKTVAAERIREALEAGITQFGENRVQEAQDKWPAVKKAYPHAVLRLIGPLQTNKVKDALALFDVIETLDREKLVDAIAAALAGATNGQRREFYVQVNTGAEAQKAGARPEAVDGLVAYAKSKGLNVNGLMCIPPADENPAPHFALLRQIAQHNGLPNLSMGMSGDYETAIRFGATHVRIGTALFGARQ